MVDGSNNWGMDCMVRSSMDSMVGNQRGSMDSVVGNHRGRMDSVVSHRVDGGLVYRLRVCLAELCSSL